jgi:hypothetical protein
VSNAALKAINVAWPQVLPEDLDPRAVRVGASGWQASFEHGDYQYAASPARSQALGSSVVDVERVRFRGLR